MQGNGPTMTHTERDLPATRRDDTRRDFKRTGVHTGFTAAVLPAVASAVRRGPTRKALHQGSAVTRS
jgi:hypothetical protein